MQNTLLNRGERGKYFLNNWKFPEASNSQLELQDGVF